MPVTIIAAQSRRLLALSEAAELLGVHCFKATRWANEGLLPKVSASSPAYPIEFIELVLDFSGGIQLSPERLRFCLLAWRYRHGDRRAKDLVKKEILEEVRKGILIGPVAASKYLGHPERSVVRWATDGRLKALKIGGRHYFLKRDVLNLKVVMDGLTDYEAAEALGISRAELRRHAAGGRIRASWTPDGYRFTEEAIEEFIAACDPASGLLTTAQVMIELGVAYSNVVWLAERGELVPHPRGKPWAFDPDDVRELAQARQRLNSGFEWLTDNAEDKEYATQKVARVLGISRSWLSLWAEEGLLPFRNLCPRNPRRAQRMYVAAYVDGLVAFASERPVRISEAREYAAMCRDAGKLI